MPGIKSESSVKDEMDGIDGENAVKQEEPERESPADEGPKVEASVKPEKETSREPVSFEVLSKVA